MAIAAITFDFWCTLFRDANSPERQALRIDAFSKRTGASRAEVRDALSAVWLEFDRHHRHEQRTLSPEDAVQLTAQRLDLGLEPDCAAELAEVFGTAILQYPPVPIDGALDAVRLAAKHRPVAVISDTGVSPGSSLRALLVRHGFSEFFSALTFSDEVGVAKPQAPMFSETARRLGVDACDLLHIGDREDTDVAGAQAVGACAGLFVGDRRDDVAGTKADFVFHTWQAFVEELPQILR